jgi:3-hydroxyisobutyrate dehydrogenase-like beta-hydroxyacid dehydrogenase
MSSRIAVLGLGYMGSAMAERLIAQGLEIAVWSRALEKRDPLVALSATAAATPAEAAATADIVVLSLFDEASVEHVAFGPDGVASTLRPGSVVLDTTTMGPSGAQRLAARLHAETGAYWADCPVSGGPGRVRDGYMIGFWGGDPACEPVIASIAASLFGRLSHMGASGSGQMTKLCNQLIVSGFWQLIVESYALGTSVGIDGKTLVSAMTGGLADGPLFQVVSQRLADHAYDPPTGAITTMLKDVRLIAAAAQAGGVDLPMQRATLALYEAAKAAGLGDREPTSTIELRQPGSAVTQSG